MPAQLKVFSCDSFGLMKAEPVSSTLPRLEIYSPPDDCEFIERRGTEVARRPRLGIFPKPDDEAINGREDRNFSQSLVLSRVLALFLMVPALPIIGFCVLLVRWTTRGPGIYCQRRIGYQGREFVLYKIRSMYDDAESETGAVWASPNDPRVTPVGRFLRWSHLDELPQLVNVLRGEMSLVGPRPERQEIVTHLEKVFPTYRERLQVYPGITGLAQLRQGPDTELESVRSKLASDLAYIDGRVTSRLLDVRILLATLLHCCGLSRDRAARLTKLDTIGRVWIETCEPIANQLKAA
jgi:lipopolysaccharide/colanic/teichoic acid biosynthesis glycosyltransferase